MKVHHLNCGSMNSPTEPMVCHVLLVETDNGLVLVDSGFGLRDIAEPARRLGFARHLIKPVLREAETAAHQRGEPDLMVVSAHDPVLLERAQS